MSVAGVGPYTRPQSGMGFPGQRTKIAIFLSTVRYRLRFAP